VSAFQEYYSTLIKLHVGGTSTDDPGDVLKPLLSAFIQNLVTLHHRSVQLRFFHIFLQIVNIGDFDIQKAVKRERQIKSVRHNNISGFCY
jgi:hypothetical protein